MQALLNTAIKAARRAGDKTHHYLNKLQHVEVREKGRNEFVTQVDLAAEQMIVEAIQKRYPDHAFLCEESGQRGNSDFLWIIDPLDGTTNFIHGFPVFAVSIALKFRDQLEVGVVYDPNRQELFTAMRGQGAQVDGHRIRVSNRSELDGTLIGTGLPYRGNRRWLPQYMAMLESVIENTAGIRRPGSAALDLAYLAAGRLDGFWEFGLKSWDIAAGTLLVQEAGGIISDLTGDESPLDSGNVIAATPRIYEPLKKLLREHL